MHENDPAAWLQMYDAAMRETDSSLRWQLIMEAQNAILDRAQALEEQGGSDAECNALEAAADALAKMKLGYKSDGKAT